MIPHRRLATICLLVLCLRSPAFAEEQSARETIYRVQPPGHQLVAVPREELKIGFVYKYFNPRLSRYVWGIASEGGGFTYALGQGTMQPANRFDIRLSTSETQQLLNQQAPGLTELLKSTGSDLFLRLGDAEAWEIHSRSSKPSVFDQLTGRRWERDGGRRVAVMHTGGYQWREKEGRYFPVNLALDGTGSVTAGCPCASMR